MSPSRPWLFLFALAAASACAGDDGDDRDPDVVASVPAADERPEVETQAELREGSAPGSEVCALLPTDDSACAHACDPAALEALVPPGTCASFECPLSDGTVLRTGTCHPAN